MSLSVWLGFLLAAILIAVTPGPGAVNYLCRPNESHLSVSDPLAERAVAHGVARRERRQVALLMRRDLARACEPL